MRCSTKLLFRHSVHVVLLDTIKPPSISFRDHYMFEKSSLKFGHIRDMIFIPRGSQMWPTLSDDFSNMQWAQKLILGGLIVSSSTTECLNNSFVEHRMVENRLHRFDEKHLPKYRYFLELKSSVDSTLRNHMSEMHWANQLIFGR